MLDWEWYQDLNTSWLFQHLLKVVNRKSGKFRGIEIKPGQYVTSLSHLVNTTPLTEQSIRTALKHLETTGEVTQTIYPKFRIITVNNWDMYQEANSNLTPNYQQTNNQLSANQQATNNNQRNKEVKKERSKEDVVVSVMNLFNQTCPSLPKLVDVSSDVRQQRILELNSFLLEHQMTWNRFFEIVEASDYLTGRSGKWKRCNFDWIIKRDNYIKIIEGRFDENWTDSEYTQENRKQKARSHVYTNEGSSYDLSGRLPCDAWDEDY